MKRLRKLAKIPKPGIRFFHCGEYGEMLGRPHYHACLFNFDFDDKVLWSVNQGHRFYISPSLSKLWPYGHSLISDVTFESAAYVARYVVKKINGEAAVEHYKGLKPEYVTMSRRPGIGRGWYDKFKDDVYPHDYTVIRGKKVHPPKFYDRIYELTDPDMFSKVKASRVARSMVKVNSWNDLLQKNQMIDDNGDDRLAVKEVCVKDRLSKYKRNLEGA